jgi:DNA-binding NarL/FixJ family response regulator
VRAILAAAPDIGVMAEAGDDVRPASQPRTHRPDMALLDIRMPVLDGLGAAAERRRTLPGVAVVMLTTFSEDEYITAALDGGASGFLLMSGDPYELMAAIRAVHAGGAFLSPRIAQRVIQQVTGGRMSRQSAAREGRGALPWEREVLAPVGAGLSNAEIGERLPGRMHSQGVRERRAQPSGGAQPCAGRRRRATQYERAVRPQRTSRSGRKAERT